MSNKSKLILWIVSIVVVIYALFALDIPYGNRVDDFVTCAAAGNAIMESYPRQCRDKEGKVYTEVLPTGSSTTTTSDLIRIVSPLPNASVSSPITVTGEARGTWFFEASFPVQILGADGSVLAQAPAQAQGEWMTTEFVGFSATIPFTPGNNLTGTIRFVKDNPSGDPERDMHVDVPVVFSAAGASTGGTGTTVVKACRPTGCSSQICSDEDMMTTCEYRSQYACYKTAECKRQSNGQCGWTQDSTLLACLNNPQ